MADQKTVDANLIHHLATNRDVDQVLMMLNIIEQNAYVLTDAAQKQMIAYKVILETGRGFGEKTSGLAPAAIQEIAQVYVAILSEIGRMPNAEHPLTLGKIFKDLSTADKMLSPQEKQFLQALIHKVAAQKVALAREEMEALLRLYTRKGF